MFIYHFFGLLFNFTLLSTTSKDTSISDDIGDGDVIGEKCISLCHLRCCDSFPLTITHIESELSFLTAV